MRRISFKALGWTYCDDENGDYFYVNGLTKDEKTVIIRIDGFTPFVNIELPLTVDWNEYTCQCLLEFIISKSKRVRWKDEELDLSPLPRFKVNNKFGLYHKIPGKYMLLMFNTNRGCKYLTNIFNRKCEIPGVGIFERNDFMVHEHNIDPIIKLTAVRNLDLCSWILCEEYIPKHLRKLSQDNRKFSTADIDMYVNYKSLEKDEVSDEIQPRAKLFSWDIEVYSNNHNSKMPGPEDPANKVIQISVVTCRYGEPFEKWKRYILTLRHGYDVIVDNTKTIHFKSEKSLLLGFTQIMQKTNPDIILGYNILKFDWDYVIKRADMLGIYSNFVKLGRILGMDAKRIKKDWTSSAYGQQKFECLECQGRLTIDLLVEIERNFKFDKYSLDFVSEHFLGEHKRPLSAKQLFKIYQFSKVTENYHYNKISNSYLKNIKKTANIIFDDEDGITKEFCNDIISSDVKNIKQVMSKGLAIIADYCVYDSILPLKLLFQLNTLFGLEQMANIFCIPISYLQSRGQQIKVLAQVYRYTLYHNIVIPYKKYIDKEEKEKYQGATVIDAVAGFWENIVTFDFASLYPSVMIANNLDFTTFVDPNNDDVPNNECNIIEWEDHVGCIHDPSQRKKKKSDILCRKNRYKFKKCYEKDGVMMNMGVLPTILTKLLTTRSKIKDEIKNLTIKLKEPNIQKEELSRIKTLLIVLDAKQLAVKVSANSIYGSTGAMTGFFPLIPIAASTTAKGREYIQKAIKYILGTYPIAKLVYGDTDSCMIHFSDKKINEIFELAKKLSRDVTVLFPKPVSLEFECVYGKFLLLTKKRYYAHKIDPSGKIFEIVKKGIVLKRRDNVHYLKYVYGELINDIINKENKDIVLYNLYNNINKLFTKQVDEKDLILYKGISDILSYAKKEKLPDPDGKTIERIVIDKLGKKKTLIEPIMLEYYLGKDKKPLMDRHKKPYKPTGPLDSNLLYGNISHVMLALKMTSRGDIVPPNTRLQYIFLDTGKSNELQSEKIEDYIYFKENKISQKLKLDSVYYLEKQLLKPIDEILNILYSKNIKFVSLDDKINSLELKLQDENFNLISKMKDIILYSTNNKNSDIYHNCVKIVKTRIKSNINLNNLNNLVKLYFIKKSNILMDNIRRTKKKVIKRKDVHLENIMVDILKIRTSYKHVVMHLNKLFNRLSFE